MRTYILECEMMIACSLQETFSFFEDPANLSKITPPWLNFQMATKEPVRMRRGAAIDYRIRYLGFPMHWTSIIGEYEPPFLFVDEQAHGPYAFWRHRHTFSGGGPGTKVADHVEYGCRLAHWADWPMR